MSWKNTFNPSYECSLYFFSLPLITKVRQSGGKSPGDRHLASIGAKTKPNVVAHDIEGIDRARSHSEPDRV